MAVAIDKYVCPFCGQKALFVGVHDDEGNYKGRPGCDYESNSWSGLCYAIHHDGWGDCILCTDAHDLPLGGCFFDTEKEALEAIPTLTPPNEPLKQADINKMHFDRVWIDYGVDDSGERCGEDGVILYGKLYSIDMLDGSAFEDLLPDACDGETLDRPSGDYTVYRRLPEAKDNNVPTNEPLTIEQLREMDEPTPVWWEKAGYWCLCERGFITAPNGNIYEFEETDGAFYRRPPEGDEGT